MNRFALQTAGPCDFALGTNYNKFAAGRLNGLQEAAALVMRIDPNAGDIATAIIAFAARSDR